jgi:hypothetical protein
MTTFYMLEDRKISIEITGYQLEQSLQYIRIILQKRISHNNTIYHLFIIKIN